MSMLTIGTVPTTQELLLQLHLGSGKTTGEELVHYFLALPLERRLGLPLSRVEIFAGEIDERWRCGECGGEQHTGEPCYEEWV